jgi:hypothetical protein
MTRSGEEDLNFVYKVFPTSCCFSAEKNNNYSGGVRMAEIVLIIMSASLLVIAFSMVVIIYFLVRFRMELNRNMQSQVSRYDCILTMLTELTRTQDDSRILLANMESHLRRIIDNKSKDRQYGYANVENAAV